MSQVEEEEVPVCEKCGQLFYEYTPVDTHKRLCHDAATFDGECPMCGEEYDSYLTHLSRCPAEE
jgi:uncharacterized protein (DUF983 family)